MNYSVVATCDGKGSRANSSALLRNPVRTLSEVEGVRTDAAWCILRQRPYTEGSGAIGPMPGLKQNVDACGETCGFAVFVLGELYFLA